MRKIIIYFLFLGFYFFLLAKPAAATFCPTSGTCVGNTDGSCCCITVTPSTCTGTCSTTVKESNGAVYWNTQTNIQKRTCDLSGGNCGAYSALNTPSFTNPQTVVDSMACGHVYYYKVGNGSGGQYCYVGATVYTPAAQSCPTACHTDTQYVPNGSCGQTTCPPNAPAAQSCPTTCHTNTQYVPNGSCGQTTCSSNAPAAQSCPTTCHTDTQYVSNGSCGQTTCPPNPPAAQSCSTTCHTNTQYVPNGACGQTTCSPNAPAAQSCPTTCHTDTQYVPDGNCGQTTCPPTSVPCTTNADCGGACGATGTCVNPGTCSAYCVSITTFNNAGVVVSAGAISAGSGNVSQGGVSPGFRLQNYTNQAATSQNATNLSYATFRDNVLKNAGVGTVKSLDTSLKTYNYNQPYVVNNYRFWSFSDTSSLDTAIGYAKADSTANAVNVIVPRLSADQSVPVINSLVISAADVVVPAGKKIVVFVNGSLTVNKNICDNSCASAPTDTVSSIVFVLNNAGSLDTGGLTLLSTVTRLDGIYVFPGAFSDGVDATGTYQLVGYGSLIGTGTANLGDGLNRTFSTGNAPAEQWIYQPKYLVQYKSVLAVPIYTWSEQLPQ